MRVATIDIGTNTVLLLIAEKRGSTLEPVEERATITRLGAGVDRTRTLAPDAVARTNACLDDYAEIVRRHACTAVAVVGTSAMRDAGGGDAVRDHVKARFGVEARTISGAEEARLTFAGALSGIDAMPGEITVFDIGGGSTEVVRGDPRSRVVTFAKSFDVGSVRLTERHVRSDPPTSAERGALGRAAREAFAGVEIAAGGAPVGIAGTMTTLAAVSLKMAPYDGRRVHGMRMRRADVAAVVDTLAKLPMKARCQLPGLEPKRADVIVAGGEIALALLERLAVAEDAELVISDRGVRWGLAEELAR